MFEEQAKHEQFKTVKAFYTCKQEDCQTLSSYLLKMKSYLNTLECLGYAMPKEPSMSLILNSLNKDYDQFVQNYNMHSMGKMLAELHAMLKLHEKGISKKVETPTVLAIREGNFQKDRMKPQGVKGKAKGKNKLAYAPKTKFPPPNKRDNLANDSICHLSKETLIDMVRSMMNLTTLPKSFWGYALETVARILNMVSIKKVDRIPYEIWHEKAPNLMVQEVSGSHELLEMSKSDKGLEIIQEEDTQPSKNTSKEHNEVAPIDVKPQNFGVPIRRSTRIPQAPDRYGYYVDIEEYELGDLDEPPNYKAALTDPESDKWLEAMNTKIQSIKDNQTSRSWNKRFDGEIKKIGFTHNPDEPCVYLKASGSNVAFLVLYVDDILLMGNSVTLLKEVKYWLLPVNDMGILLRQGKCECLAIFQRIRKDDSASFACYSMSLNSDHGGSEIGNSVPVSFALMLKDKTVRKMVKLAELTNNETVQGVTVVIPLVAVEELHNVPIVASSEIGLSLITTKLGKPIMLDGYTSNMCINSWGRNSYARAVIEVLAENALMDSIVVSIPLQNGSGHTLKAIDLEYEWQPSCCDTRKIFDHNDT
nr:zinc finger, CCHC-type [Tanacetum cinerariifolium]